jgi:hypothetical protein
MCRASHPSSQPLALAPGARFSPPPDMCARARVCVCVRPPCVRAAATQVQEHVHLQPPDWLWPQHHSHHQGGGPRSRHLGHGRGVCDRRLRLVHDHARLGARGQVLSAAAAQRMLRARLDLPAAALNNSGLRGGDFLTTVRARTHTNGCARSRTHALSARLVLAWCRPRLRPELCALAALSLDHMNQAALCLCVRLADWSALFLKHVARTWRAHPERGALHSALALCITKVKVCCACVTALHGAGAVRCWRRVCFPLPCTLGGPVGGRASTCAMASSAAVVGLCRAAVRWTCHSRAQGVCACVV